MRMRKIMFTCTIIFIMINAIQELQAQSQLTLTPGGFYNGTFLSEDVSGFGVIVGLEYMCRPDHFFSIELRTKYGYYSFDDGTKWRVDKDEVLVPPINKGEARLEYSLFSPQIGLVPKFYLRLDEEFSLFLENELSAGLMSGRFRYKGVPDKKQFTDLTLSYNVGIGVDYKLDKYTLSGSIGYSTLNFADKIRKHQPQNYQEVVPNQNAALWINILFKVPLTKKSRR